MPVAPYTWQTQDFISAQRLMDEMRQSNGSPFQRNGSGWHAKRPVYRAFLNNPSGITETATGWTEMSGASTYPWLVTADNAPMFGGYQDNGANGTPNGSNIPNSGGVTGNSGGLGILISHTTYNAPASGTPVFYGGISGTTAPNVSPYGTVGGGVPSGVGTGLFSIDLRDWSASSASWCNANTASQVISAAGEDDGSGSNGGRLQAFWASVYAGNGTKVSAIPTLNGHWASGTALTSAALNANIQQTFDLLNMPPVFRACGPTGTSIAASASPTIVKYTSAMVTQDTYSGYSTSTGLYTAPLPGLYLCYSTGGMDSTPSATMTLSSAIAINGTVYQGPNMVCGSSHTTIGAKVQVFSLQAGDTIAPYMTQNYTSAEPMSAEPSTFIVVWLGMNGTPAYYGHEPDPSYMFAAGTSGADAVVAFNGYVQNELEYLLYRPWTAAYQTTTQAISMSTNTSLAYQAMQGIVHSDASPWGSWNSAGTGWTAPNDGYYLFVAESFTAAPTLTTDPSICSAILVPGGLAAWDHYNSLPMYGSGAGTAAVCIYYLKAGDTINSGVYTANSSSTTISTDVYSGTTHFQPHFEAVWLSN